MERRNPRGGGGERLDGFLVCTGSWRMLMKICITFLLCLSSLLLRCCCVRANTLLCSPRILHCCRLLVACLSSPISFIISSSFLLHFVLCCWSNRYCVVFGRLGPLLYPHSALRFPTLSPLLLPSLQGKLPNYCNWWAGRPKRQGP